jgi:hypothetical protein
MLSNYTNTELIELVVKSGTKAAAARNIGVPVSTLKDEIIRRDLNKKIEEKKAKVVEKYSIDELVSKEEILEEELAEARKALTTARKRTVGAERIDRAIESALDNIRPSNSLKTPEPQESTGEDPHHRQLLVLSDFHGGENVDPDAVNGLNNYSWDIMEQRTQEVIDALISHKQYSPPLSGIDVVIVGDQCSGSNHQELAETNDIPLAEQGVKMGFLQGEILESIAPHYQEVYCTGVVGNHPRLTKLPAAKRIHDNMDYVSYRIAQEYVKNFDNITMEVPTSAATFHEIAGKTLYVWHGDGIRSSMPGVPWGGVMRRTNEIRRAHNNRHIDGWILGHFHQANVMHDLMIFMNGSLKGVDEWTLKQFGGGGLPAQLLLTFDEKRQRLTDVKFITPSAGLQ